MTSQGSSVRTYLVIWAWLAGLMLLGVALSWTGLSKVAVVSLVLGLSSIKAVLVALYYMHLKLDRRILALVAAAPLFLILLAVGVVLSSRLVRL
jgi:caa(3)-type oxidase subunit IV